MPSGIQEGGAYQPGYQAITDSQSQRVTLTFWGLSQFDVKPLVGGAEGGSELFSMILE